MKTIYKLLLVLAASGAMASCNRWLDIMPEDMTTEKQLFSNAGGYHSAINGLYQTMASSSLYGQNLTWGFTSALSQYYDNSSEAMNKAFSYTEKYEYSSDEVKRYGEDIWQTAYNVVANSNNILQHLETAEPSMFPEYEHCEMDVIKGEALAVRALMHFELVRLFGGSPAEDINAKAVPYVKDFPASFTDRGTIKSVLDNVLADFEQASNLLAKNDTTRSDESGSFSGLYMGEPRDRYRASNQSRNYFFTARGSRLNYVAVKALMARVYSYAGDLAKADEIAAELIDKYSEKKQWYTFTTSFSDSDSEKYRPHKLIDELLVSFYNERLALDYTAETKVGKSSNSYVLNNIDNMYKDNDDFRRKLLSTLDVDKKVSMKYRERDGGSELVRIENRLLPIMRLSELYFIRIEYLAKNGQVAEAVKLLNHFRVKRGCMGNKIPEDATSEVVLDALNLEVWRDNVAEGQYFFFLKKNNAPYINDNGVHIDMKGKYTMLIPDSETNFN